MNAEPMRQEFDAFKNKMFETALEYLDRGWSIFPLDIAGKKPLIKWREYQTRQPTYEEVDEWFSKGVVTESGAVVEFFNLGLVTGAISGYVVVDCDNEEALEYAQEHGLTTGFSVNTTRGKHFYWKHPNDGARFQNKVGGTGRDWPDVHGLDFRGDGGFVIVPPSVSFFPDGTFKHQYGWESQPHLDWNDDMPVWAGKPSLLDVTDAEDFDFGRMDLSSIRVPRPEDTMSVRERMAKKIDDLGHKLQEGDGRNQWIVKFAGERVRIGVTSEELRHLCEGFQDEFFDEPLDEQEFERTIQSVEEMDRRNHPSDYDSDGNRKIDGEVKQEVAKQSSGWKTITYDDIDEIEKNLSKTRYFLDPLVAPGTITQIIGFNGHGKSYLALTACWHMANGISFGPFVSDGHPSRVMYFDHENPASTLIDRMRDFGNAFGKPGEFLQVWSPSVIPADKGGEINLRTESGLQTFGHWIDSVVPDVVVIDTIRSAFPGMSENSAEEWAQVNYVAKLLRNRGCAVIVLHHRNKPSETGLGREAGSTAQLTDVDSQVLVTQVYRDKDAAKMQAGLADADLSVRDFSGVGWTPWGYLEDRHLKSDERIKFVLQVAYGKVRQLTDNHITNYVGWAENINTGKMRIVSTPSPRQKAIILAATMDVRDIAQKLMIPARTISRWVGK